MPFPLDNFRSPAALLRFAGVAGAGVAVDLWTKSLAEQHLQHRTIEFVPGLLHFVYTTNPGAVFGLGEGLWPLFLIVSVLAIGFLGTLFAYSDRQRFYQFVLGLLLAGVLGNMYDRIMFQEVRDMIHAVPRWPWLFPWVFNLADSFLCVGVALMVLLSILPKGAPISVPAEQGKA